MTSAATPPDLQPSRAGRYTVVPRTLSFLLRERQLLLLRLAPDRKPWGGRLNGIGGHVEAGEDPWSAARREIREETGLEPIDLRLCGTVIVEMEDPPGIGLFIFVGRAGKGAPAASSEGGLEWASLDALAELPLVEDLPALIPPALRSYAEGRPFSGITRFRRDGPPEVNIFP